MLYAHVDDPYHSSFNDPYQPSTISPPYPLMGILSRLKISLRTYCSLSSFCLSLSTRPSSVRGSGRWSPPVFSFPITKNTTSSRSVVMLLGLNVKSK